MRIFATVRGSLSRSFPGIGKDASGIAAVEFAIVAPVFCLILAGAIDLSGMLYTRYGLDAAVSAASNYALLDAASVNSTSGASLAQTLQAIVTSSSASDWANSTIVVNNGPTIATTVVSTTSASTATSGTATNADSCYCPTLGASGVIWGSAVTCGGSCPSGGLAGKFVYIAANRTYTPFFPTFGFVQNGQITTSAMVQTQ